MPHYSPDERKILRKSFEDKIKRHGEYFAGIAVPESELRKTPADYLIILKLLDDLDESGPGVLARRKDPPSSDAPELRHP